MNKSYTSLSHSPSFFFFVVFVFVFCFFFVCFLFCFCFCFVFLFFLGGGFFFLSLSFSRNTSSLDLALWLLKTSEIPGPQKTKRGVFAVKADHLSLATSGVPAVCRIGQRVFNDPHYFLSRLLCVCVCLCVLQSV